MSPRCTISVTIRMWPDERMALERLAARQRLSRSQLLRQALAAYARSVFSRTEYDQYYPIDPDVSEDAEGSR